MATLTQIRRPVKAATQDASGTCRMVLHIDGTAYRGRPISLDPRSDIIKAYRLSKQAGEGKAPTSGREVRICPECEGRLRTKGTWPRDDRGEELCQVSRGLARGECDLCSPDAGE